MTPYDLLYGRNVIARCFKICGSKCYNKRDEEDIGNFDSRNDEGIFLGYSRRRKSYKCYNKRLKKIVERKNVKVDENSTQAIEEPKDCGIKSVPCTVDEKEKEN